MEEVLGLESERRDIHLSRFGSLLDEEDQLYIWMVPYFIGTGPKSMDFKQYMHEITIQIPLLEFNWHALIKSAKEFIVDNFYPFVTLLAGGLAAFHYKQLLSLTVNFSLNEDLRSFERTIPINFSRLITTGDKDSFLEKRKAISALANTSCLPSVIRMGVGLDEANLQPHTEFFRNSLAGLPSRLPSIYSSLRYFAFEVISLVFDDEVISKEQFDKPIYKHHKGTRSIT
ncbi:hypothetical protein AC249_AIPGENE6378 [Exaiptasia diaphana]|nr:hypothetical protein AC249_AIPGENE6378 [Exaiptasia diaphana]